MEIQAAAATALEGTDEGRASSGGRRPLACLEIETPARTEARLRAVLRTAQIEVLKTDYAWESIRRETFPTAISAEAVVLAQGQDGWSQLVPIAGARRTDAWALVAFHFRPRANTDGFTDWLATYFRRRVSSRVIVASGFKDRTGGSHFYWGVPAVLRDALARELAILATFPTTGVRAVGLL